MTADHASRPARPRPGASAPVPWGQSTAAGLAQAAVSGAATLIDPRRFRPRTRRCFRAGLALLIGAAGGLAWRSGFRAALTAPPEDAAVPCGSPDAGQRDAEQRDAECCGTSEETAAQQVSTAQRVSTVGSIAVGGLLAGAVYASLAGSAAVDARIQRALAARGVARPRAVMAVGAAVLSWVLFELERHAPQGDRSAGSQP